MDGQELTADQFLQQTDSSVMNSIQSFVQHANNLEETLGITSSWYLQNNLEFSSWKWENRQKSPKSSTFVTILKSRFCQASSKIDHFTWKSNFSLQLFKLCFYLEWVQVGTSKCSRIQKRPFQNFLRNFQSGKTANFLKMIFVRAVRGHTCPETGL